MYSSSEKRRSMAKYKGLPKVIKVGQRIYDVHVRNESQDPTLSDCYGYTMVNFDHIVLNDNLSLAKSRGVLLHELLHVLNGMYANRATTTVAVDGDAEYSDKYDAWEHYFIGVYQESVVTLLRDNPDLVAFLTSGE